MSLDHETARETAITWFDEPPEDPIPALRDWLGEARQYVLEAGALALATTGIDGRASTRMVQVLDVRDEGVVFTSHATSQKGKEIAATGWASGVLYWRETKQQVILSGPIAPLPTEESERLWAARAPTTYPMSVASHQSEILDDEDELRERAAQLAQSAQPLARPERWIGYALRPRIVEFWVDGRDRLHRRLRYTLAPSGWTRCRLQP